ncbi:MAG TPA: heavy-metal-associated domain-containing protein [Firmicutes bacterium]|nr:heavy-metal-associated domain-containing protein [Bacillota bacterium]
MTKKVYIEGMSCQHCVNRVKDALNAVEGIAVINVDLDNNVAMIEVPPFMDEVKIKDAVSEAGYEVKRIE